MNIKLEQAQKTVLGQQMTMSMEILQMDAQELEAYLQELALENPMLEIHPPAETRTQSWSSVPTNFPGPDSGTSFGGLRNAEQDRSLKDDISEQISTAHIPELLRRELRYLVGEMDEEGYLPPDPGDLRPFGYSSVRYDNAVKVLQSLEPAGVGARSLSERLCIQLRRQGVTDELPYLICRDYLEPLAKGQLNLIAKRLEVPKRKVAQARDIITALDPRPSNGFSGTDTAPYVIPDIELVQRGGRFSLVPADRYMHTYSVDQFYQKMAQDPDLSPEEQAYFRSKLSQAKWAIGCVDRRRETLCACVSGILDRQYNFFLGLTDTLAPFTMTELAAEMGVAVSTVSRAVRGKYLSCQRGTFPLAMFFAKEINGPDSGTRQDAMTMIQKMIAGETPDDPLSDRAIAEQLAEYGLQLSRRTVAKYRESLGIPSAVGRRGRNQSS